MFLDPKPETVSDATNVEAFNPPIRYRPRVLIAEHDRETAEQIRDYLESGLRVSTTLAFDGKQALESLRNGYFSLVLTELKLPSLDAVQLIQEVKSLKSPAAVVVISSQGNVENAVAAMRSGAYDFLTKPLDMERLGGILRQALQERARQDEVIYLRENSQQPEAFRHILTRNPRMLSVLDLVPKIAQTSSTVLIEGETGTGKELIAQAIHTASLELRPGPIVAVNCAALPENLLESELFGHEKGSFTGAVAQRVGRFEQARQGTLFLDEIGEIPPAMQVKLLRVLQERQIQRVGGSETIPVDVRVITASNRSLERLVRKGVFREDLYYRVNVVRIELPPLRERPEDIPLLARHFCAKYAKPGGPAKEIAPEALQVLLGHDWPGNARELENAIERACVTCPDAVMRPEHFASDFFQQRKKQSVFQIDLNRRLPDLRKEVIEDVEARYLRKALMKTRGNIGRCAKLCGLSRRCITAKLAAYGIHREEMKAL